MRKFAAGGAQRSVVLAVVLVASVAVPADARWRPAVDDTLHIQFAGTLDRSIDVDVYEVDGFDTPRRTVRSLHDRGRRVVCYLSAGSHEDWRPDADRYPESVLGEPLDGWPGERWVDIRQRDVLAPILADRIAMCARKGFDAVEFDNVNGYTNDTGFALTRSSQLRFNRMLAALAHDAGLSVGLKNSPELVTDLVGDFDFAVVEQCFQYDECRAYRPFERASKPVWVLEYELTRREFCDRAAQLGFVAQRKRFSLDAWRRPCPGA